MKIYANMLRGQPIDRILLLVELQCSYDTVILPLLFTQAAAPVRYLLDVGIVVITRE